MSPALLQSQVSAPAYSVVLRSLQTLEPIQFLAWFETLGWTRNLYGAGDFVLQAHIDDIDASALLHPTRSEVQETVIEIQRDGALEFAGVFDTIEPDEATGMLTIQGLDLLSYLLSSREIIPPDGSAYDVQESVVAETAILHYIQEHLSAPSDSDRDIETFLDGVTFTTSSSQGRGNTVTLRARYLSLVTAVGSLAREGGLVVSIAFQDNYAGYQLTISEPVDRRAGQDDAVVFSVAASTALTVRPRYSRRRRVNVIYGLGQGSGAYRTVVERDDTDDTATHSRREASADERSQATSANLELAANPSGGETVTIGSKVYTFQTTLTNSDGNVQIGADRDESLANLAAAINLAAGAGTLYASATTANGAAQATGVQGGELTVAATGSVTPVALSETLANGSWSASEIDLSGMQAALGARLDRSEKQGVSYRVEPDPAGAPYRTSWDLGDDVTVRSDLLGISHDLRIQRVKVGLDANRYETVAIDVGEPPETLPRLVAGAVSATNNVLRE